MKRVLVTGAQGFIGRFVCARLLADESYDQIIGIGRSPKRVDSFTHSISLSNQTLDAPLLGELVEQLASDRYQYQTIDLCQYESLAKFIEEIAPCHVLHLASGLRGDRAEKLVQINVVGTVNLLRAIESAKNNKCESVVIASSGGVYGIPGKGQLPFNESSICDPVDEYSATKLAMEQITKVLGKTLNLPVSWARIFNVVGPGQDERHVCGRFASQLAAIRFGLLDPVVEVQNLETSRDFIDVRDVAEAMALIAKLGTPGLSYNVGSGRETRIQEILNGVIETAELEDEVQIKVLPSRATDIPRHFADITRIGSIEYQSQYTLSESIGDLFEYYGNIISNLASRAESSATQRLSE